MKERPILFSGAMVRAILDDRKTKTRRVIKPNRGAKTASHVTRVAASDGAHWVEPGGWVRCPYGEPGDRLWVRETWRTEERANDGVDGIRFRADGTFVPIAPTREAADLWVDAHDNGRHGDDWRPSIFLKRWASRITLEVTDVSVGRLQEITEEDAQAEGVTPFPYNPEGDIWDAAPQDRKFRTAFEYLWGMINGFAEADAIRPGYSWAANPYVWVVSFRRVA